MTTIPTKAGPDTVCACGHWWEEHDNGGPCGGCDAASAGTMDTAEDLAAHVFEFWPEYNTPEAIADRGGDPDYWPEWVKAAFS